MSNIEVQYINHMGDDLTVVNAARVSFGSTKKTLDSKDEKLIKYLSDNKHFSPFEHCTLTVKITVPIYISKQIMRHRTFSYNEISRRYTSKNMKFFIPDEFRKQSTSDRQASAGIINDSDQKLFTYMVDAYQFCFQAYEELLSAGVCREQARGVLPQNLVTEFYMTGNLRNWIHFVDLRIDKHAQQEIQLVGNKILTILKDKFPKSTEAL